MTPGEVFAKECAEEVERQGADAELSRATSDWLVRANRAKYSYHFRWLGRPIIQYPQDVLAMQEIIWQVQPDLIIETGIAHGGSLIFYASLLELNAACGGPANAEVLGIDIDIREHNRAAVEQHPMSRRITMVQGSSIASDAVERARRKAAGKQRVLVSLDSNHTHDHVLAELKAYAPLTTVGSYCVVFDTIIDDLPPDTFSDRPWRPGNSPGSAVREFLAAHAEFETDDRIDHKLLISVARGGYLRRIR